MLKIKSTFSTAPLVLSIAACLSVGCTPMTTITDGGRGGYRLHASMAQTDDLAISIPSIIVRDGAGAWTTNTFWDVYA